VPSDKGRNMKVNIKVSTDGNGLWSDVEKDVTINKIEWYSDDDEDDEEYSESETYVKLYFDKRTWNIEKHGLIYTDDTFEEKIKTALVRLQKKGVLPDLPWDTISYTEQGMQGEDYVHMILGTW
jgi:hypothetical protein